MVARALARVLSYCVSRRQGLSAVSAWGAVWGTTEDTEGNCRGQGVLWGTCPLTPDPSPPLGARGLVVGCACDYGREYEYEEQVAGGAGFFLGMKRSEPRGSHRGHSVRTECPLSMA